VSVFVENASAEFCPSSSHLPWLPWLVATVFIVYATMFPFNFVSDPAVIGSRADGPMSATLVFR
jgi:hypothetical protein